MELAPERVLKLDSPVWGVARDDACYVITNKGCAYLLGEDLLPIPVARDLGRPHLASCSGRDLVLVVQSGGNYVHYNVSPGGVRFSYVLPGRVDGVSLLRDGSAVFWMRDPKSILRSRIMVVKEDSSSIFSYKRVLSAASRGNYLYLLSMNALSKVEVGPGGIGEVWSVRGLPGGCSRVLSVDGKVLVRCESEVLCFDDDGKLLWRREGRESLTPWLRNAVLWEFEDSAVSIVDLETGSVSTVKLNPVYFVVSSRENLLVVMRYKLAELSPEGALKKVVMLPIPVVENLVPWGKYVFTMREWLIVAYPRKPVVAIEKASLRSEEGRHVLDVSLSVRRPSSGLPVSKSPISVRVGRKTLTATLGEDGKATLSIPLGEGLHTLTIEVVEEVRVGDAELRYETVDSKEVEVPPPSKPVEIKVGDILGGKFVVRERLGGGGFGEVYRALDILLERSVAVKVPRRYLVGDPEDLVVEAAKLSEAARKLNREKRVVVEIYEAGTYKLESIKREEKGEVAALILEYVESGSLRSIITSDTLSQEEKVELARRIADRVYRLNEAGIIHGDLKPENILIAEGLLPILTDFYTAVFLKKFEKTRRLRRIVLTELYAPPELIERGEVNDKTDVYSLAVVIVELLTGIPPTPGNIPIKLLETAGLTSRAVETLIKCLSPEPSQRPTIPELIESLQA